MNTWLELDDDQFMFACRVRLGILRPISYDCPLIAKNLSSLSIDDFNRHVFACQHCSAPIWYARHEMIVKSIKKTCAFHDIVARIPAQNELPLIGNSKGGADLVGYLDRMWMIDVSVELSDRAAAFSRKINTYENVNNATASRTLPFILNQFGVIDSRTEAIFEAEWKSRTGARFIRDLFNVTQFEIIRGQFHGYSILSARVVTKESSANSRKQKRVDDDTATLVE
jgi:hypothetical protein